MERPKQKDYQTLAFNHFDMDAYSKDLNEYIDYLLFNQSERYNDLSKELWDQQDLTKKLITDLHYLWHTFDKITLSFPILKQEPTYLRAKETLKKVTQSSDEIRK